MNGWYNRKQSETNAGLTLKGKGDNMITEEEKWEYISKLSEIRSKYSCFEDDEEPYYRALSEGIKALKAITTTETRWYNMVAEYNFYGTGEWSVQTPEGDDIIFPTEAEAIEFIREYENEAWHLRLNML